MCAAYTSFHMSYQHKVLRDKDRFLDKWPRMWRRSQEKLFVMREFWKRGCIEGKRGIQWGFRNSEWNSRELFSEQTHRQIEGAREPDRIHGDVLSRSSSSSSSSCFRLRNCSWSSCILREMSCLQSCGGIILFASLCFLFFSCLLWVFSNAAGSKHCFLISLISLSLSRFEPFLCFLI